MAPDAHFKFLTGTRSAVWLFNDDMVRYLDVEIRNKVLALASLQAEFGPEIQGEERRAHIERERQLKSELADLGNKMDRKFAPFLKLSH